MLGDGPERDGPSAAPGRAAGLLRTPPPGVSAMFRRSHHKVLAAITLLVAAAAFAPLDVAACPFCSSQGQTLTNDAAQASMILYGRLTNARLDPNDVNAGSTDLIIE